MNFSFVAFALCLEAFVLPISLAATNGALALLTLALLLRLRGEDGRRIRASWRAEPALLAVAVYVAAGVVAALCGIGARHSLHDCAKDLHRLWSLGLFVAALTLEPDAPLWPAFAAGFSAIAVFGISQSARGINQYGDVARAHGFVHPVTFGEQLALAALGGLCWLARPTSADRRVRLTARALTLVCAVALALSQTRAALLALVIGAAVIAALEPRSRRWAAGSFVLGVVGAVFAEWVRHGRAVFGDKSSTPDTRYALWSAAWRMFKDHPLTGVGPGHYKTLFTQYFSKVLEGEADWGTAHNLYLHQMAERGLIGAVALAALLWVLLTRAFRAERARRDAAALCAAAAVPTFLVMNMTETALQTEQFATLFLLIWAFGTRRRGAEIL